MPTQDEIEEILTRRKRSWADRLRREPKRAREMLEKYGAPGVLETMGAGAWQGITHSFGDDIERSRREDRTAQTHIRAQAARPGAYLLSQLGGLGLTGLLLRGGGGAIGKQRAASHRAGNRTVAGGAERQAKIEAEAKQIEDDWTNWKGMSPRTRAIALDAGHGAALGYGGGDVGEDEKALSVERAMRAGLGGALGLVGGPMSVSTAAAAGNLPLLFGKRRAFSEKMLEPPGVTRATPEGRPREAIDIARSRDEALARGAGEPSAMVRDTTPPMQTQRPTTQRLADQALEPIAARRIDELAMQERNAAADSIVAAHPDRRAREVRGRLSNEAHRRRLAEAGTNRQGHKIEFRTETGRPAAVHFHPDRSIDFSVSGSMSRSRARRMPGRDVRAEAGTFEKAMAIAAEEIVRRGERSYGISGGTPAHNRLYWQTVRQNGPPPGYVAVKHQGAAPLQIVRRDVFDEANAQGAYGSGWNVIEGPPAPKGGMSGAIFPDEQLNAMLEPVVRRDRHAFESWSSTLEAMHRRDPTVLPRMRGAVAAMLARTERRSGGGHRMNDDPTTQLYLRTLGMTGNKTKGTEHVIEAARAPAARRFNSQRFQDAQARTAGGPRMRPRHAEALRREMEAYEPPTFQGEPVGTMRQPMIARGDDRRAWVNPLDLYFRPDRVNNRQVAAAGALSGPFAMLGGDAIEPALPHAPAYARRGGGEDVIDAEFTEIERPRGTLRAIAPPERAGNPALDAARRQTERLGTAEMQRILMQRAGIELSQFGDDGIVGPETRQALRTFQEAAGLPATGEVDDLTQNRLRQYRDGLLPDEMLSEIDAALGALGGQ